MSISDPSGFRRQLNYDETLAFVEKQNADAGKTLLPGLDRQATRFVQSPFFEKLKETVYEDLRNTQMMTQLATQNQANVERAAAATGLQLLLERLQEGASSPWWARLFLICAGSLSPPNRPAPTIPTQGHRITTCHQSSH